MTAQTPTDPPKAKSQPAPATPARQPWHKKSPVETILAQIDKVRDQVAAKEEELKLAKKQLQKLEEFRKVLESS